MPDDQPLPKSEAPRPAGVPKPPSEADVAQVSEDQALIADEWGDEPPGAPAKG